MARRSVIYHDEASLFEGGGGFADGGGFFGFEVVVVAALETEAGAGLFYERFGLAEAEEVVEFLSSGDDVALLDDGAEVDIQHFDAAGDLGGDVG